MLTITELTCRVCLKEQNILINIYDELEDLHTNLRNLLETCADLQIDDNDLFPKYLCEECTRELLITSKFRQKCSKSKEILDEILENNQTNASEANLALFNDNIIEYSIDELDGNEVSDFLIEEERDIVSVNNELNEVSDKPALIQKDVPLLLLNKNDTEYLNEDLLTTTEDQSPIVDLKSLIVEDNSNQSEPFVKNYFEMETSKPVEQIITDTPENFIKEPSPSKLLVEKEAKSYLVYKCDICGAIFKQAFNLQKHLQKTHGPLHCFSCVKCDHWFSKDAEFFNHMQSCNYTSNGKDHKEEYKRTKADKMFRDYLEQETDRKCIYCEKEFSTPFALRMHVRTHTGERPFQCKFCTKSFKTQSQLNVHHKRHTGQADFACAICNKAFYEQSNLTAHMRSHTGERPHICTICNKTFTRVFLLQFHMRTHTGEKPFSCTYCDKKFRQATDLRGHLTIHTGQKQHLCVLCDKSYIKRSHLVQHMRKHNISSEDMESSEKLQFGQTEISEEFSKTIVNNIHDVTHNSDMLDNFDDIIVRDDAELQEVDYR